MSFTRVSRSVKKERKNNAWVSDSRQQKNSKIMKKATKSKQQSIYSSEGRISKLNGKKH
jgi:hypothetical protein